MRIWPLLIVRGSPQLTTNAPLVVDLLRHGAVDAAEWAFRGGGTDIALSHVGWQQMMRVADHLPWDAIDEVAASPMQRCYQPAQQFSEQHDAVPVHTIEAMRELDFGAWEGKGWQELAPDYQSELDVFWQQPQGFTPPQGEPFDDFVARVQQGWMQWTGNATGHRLLIAHGGVIRVLLALILGMPMDGVWRLDLPFASWSRVSLLAGHAPKLCFLNRLVEYP
ncbi:MAG: histidine phosphatase family protein [Mariprofundales bacterium]|nr:histidine phosphatase family protein [Mariprofundales bacterium]